MVVPGFVKEEFAGYDPGFVKILEMVPRNLQIGVSVCIIPVAFGSSLGSSKFFFFPAAFWLKPLAQGVSAQESLQLFGTP